MSRPYNHLTAQLLGRLAETGQMTMHRLYTECCPKTKYKDFYNYIFRLKQQELLEKKEELVSITQEGKKLLNLLAPRKEEVWKLVIFDIPEKHKYVRTVLRAKLKQLNFKKWQNSIWVSPYALDPEIEEELRALGKKFFVRLVKTTDISHTEDLEKIFQAAEGKR